VPALESYIHRQVEFDGVPLLPCLFESLERARRGRVNAAEGNELLSLLEGLRDVSTRWVKTHDIAHWKGEIAWMSLYFSGAVWASLALCVLYSLAGELPRYRTETELAASAQHETTTRSQPARRSDTAIRASASPF
jgi:hypothetical protein